MGSLGPWTYGIMGHWMKTPDSDAAGGAALFIIFIIIGLYFITLICFGVYNFLKYMSQKIFSTALIQRLKNGIFKKIGDK